MIHLTKVRLVNWYAFQDETFPVGDFTLIAGKNGNGKSVILDAMRFAALGDTEFNKSTDTKTSRTLVSYTRGLLDATSRTFIRPIEKNPNVFSHIVLEMQDDINEKYFLLGVVLETRGGDSSPAQYRYVVDNKRIEYLKLTRIEQGRLISLTAREVQDKYKLHMQQKSEGMKSFMQFTGLKLSDKDLQEFIRRMRSMLAYDPKVKIDTFIREKVLKAEKVDFSKLIESRERIDELTVMFERIQAEIEELSGIEAQSVEYERAKMRILMDDIKHCYIKKEKLRAELESLEHDIEVASQRVKDIAASREMLSENEKELTESIITTSADLRSLDCSRSIEDEKRKQEQLSKEVRILKEQAENLTFFEQKISEIMVWLTERNDIPANQTVLADLSGSRFTSAEKQTAAGILKQHLKEIHDDGIRQQALIGQAYDQIRQKIAIQEMIIDECRQKVTGYKLIPDYVRVKEEINKEFKKRGIAEEAHFACEYVLRVKDESWQDAIEAFLGRRRYVILVDPRYYNIADEVFNRMKNKQAHLFNTPLLMKKKVEVEEDSVFYQLEIKNQMAKQYFAYQLRSMHAVPLGEVKRYENAISKEGRVSVAMDSYFLDFDSIRAYYLGSNSYRKNLEKAKKELRKLESEEKESLQKMQEVKTQCACIDADLEFFTEYNYDAAKDYTDCLKSQKESEKRLKALIHAQKHDQEFVRLDARRNDLERQREVVQGKLNGLQKEDVKVKTALNNWREQNATKKQLLEKEETDFQQYERDNLQIVQAAVSTYNRYIQGGGKVKTGNVLMGESRSRAERSIQEANGTLIGKQTAYNVHYPDRAIPVNTEDCSAFRRRKNLIWMDDLQDIKDKLASQTLRYKSIFKTEFVLGIFTHCSEAREGLKELNAKLARLDFSTVYKFDVNYLSDSSDYARIIEYGKMLSEKAERGDYGGQMNLFDMNDYEEEERLEREMDEFLGRIMAKRSEELIERYADYRNYMTYEILLSNDILTSAKLSKQAGYNSGAEIQIPYMLILASALLLMYDQRSNSTRMVFIDEPFAKMDPVNVGKMLRFMKEQNLQVIFCAPDKTEVIGNECNVILPTHKIRPDCMKIGSVKFNEG